MEKVHFQLESTLPELKDLHEKGLFSKNEIDQITKRRTAYETSLIRRQTRRDDFFTYAEYEINLERLRRVRWKRLGYHKNPPPPSASTFSLPRRAAYILKRATSKFPGDLATWLAYVEYASREGMHKVVVKGLTTALQHHPTSPTLYLLLSYHHVHPNSPFPREIIPSGSGLDLPSASRRDTGFSLEGTSAARTQLLLGLRLIPQSELLWTEYIKLELGWVEALRRRWNVLGINEDIDPQSVEADPDALRGGEGSFGPDGEDARKQILAGQLVIHSIGSALKAIQGGKGLDFRLALVDLLRVYPSALRRKCLDVVYADLERIAEEGGASGARARMAILTRGLYDAPYVEGEPNKMLSGVELVEEIGSICKGIRRRAKNGPDFLLVAGQWLIQQIEQQSENQDLRTFLLSTLSALTLAKYNPPAPLLIDHLRLITREEVEADAEILTTARRHVLQYPSNAALQAIRLKLEARFGDPMNLRDILETTVKNVTPVEAGNDESDIERVWFTWTSSEEAAHEISGTDIDGVWSTILALSTRINRRRTHTMLLARYFISTLQKSPPLPALPTIDSLAKYKVSAEFYPIAWTALRVYSAKPYEELGKMYERWRSAARTVDNRINAAMSWAGWLLSHKKAHEAVKIVDSVRREDPTEVERRWKALCDEAEVNTAEPSGDKVRMLEGLLEMRGWGGLETHDGVLKRLRGDGEDVDAIGHAVSESDGDVDEDMEGDSEEEDETEDEAMEINV